MPSRKIETEVNNKESKDIYFAMMTGSHVADVTLILDLFPFEFPIYVTIRKVI